MAVELTLRKRSISKHILLGAMAGLLIPTIYFGVVGLSMGLDNVSREAARLWYWIALLARGIRLPWSFPGLQGLNGPF